jgi:hypothetical protein
LQLIDGGDFVLACSLSAENLIHEVCRLHHSSERLVCILICIHV